MDDQEKPPTSEELAAAAAFRDGLEGREGGDPEDLAAAGAIRAAAGKGPRLGDLAARAIARAAIASPGRPALVAARPRRMRYVAAALAFAAAAALILFARPLLDGNRPDEVPARLCSRTAGMLVPGPFPDGQTAAQRLDLVTTDRLVAFREVRLRSYARGRR